MTMDARSRLVRQATIIIDSTLLDIQEQYDLTDLEMDYAIFLHCYLTRANRHRLHAERHPNDPGKGAGEA